MIEDLKAMLERDSFKEGTTSRNGDFVVEGVC
jgi:hypothetical protein